MKCGGSADVRAVNRTCGRPLLCSGRGRVVRTPLRNVPSPLAGTCPLYDVKVLCTVPVK